jgi:2-hydroxy-6-oxonona-2,4-dienedioate hydrolase
MDELRLTDEVTALAAAARVSRTTHHSGSMTWRAWGEGEPVLLLHGSHGGWMHWLRNIPVLAASRWVIAPDMPGFGESDPPEDLDSAPAHSRMLGEGLREILDGVGSTDIIAFSLGAMIACHLSFAAPEVVRRIVVVDAGGLGTPMRSPDLRGVKGVTGERLRDVNRHNLSAMMFHNPALIDDVAIDITIFGAKRVKTRVQHHVVPNKLLPVIAQVRAPIDAIWGEWDYPHPSPEANIAVIRQFQPQAELRVLPKAGHWSMYEQPDAFNAAALDLLATPARPWLACSGSK